MAGRKSCTDLTADSSCCFCSVGVLAGTGRLETASAGAPRSGGGTLAVCVAAGSVRNWRLKVD
ncbi:MAG: hypothetical protein IPI89_04605 [Propionivibrio sp.]|nr:hypothetical protein [Propionivibrio sp.]